MSYTLSEAKTNAGDSLSGGGVGGLRAPDVAGWDLKNDIGPLRFPHQACVRLQRNYELPGKRSDPRRLAHQLAVVDLQRPGADHQLHGRPPDRAPAVTRSWSAIPYAGSHDVNQFYNPAAFANPNPVATIGQTDFSPLGGKRSQVTGPPLRQLDMGVAKQFGVWGQRQFELRAEAFNVTNTPSFNLPGSLNFRDARNFASITSMRNTPAAVSAGR